MLARSATWDSVRIGGSSSMGGLGSGAWNRGMGRPVVEQQWPVTVHDQTAFDLEAEGHLRTTWTPCGFGGMRQWLVCSTVVAERSSSTATARGFNAADVWDCPIKVSASPGSAA